MRAVVQRSLAASVAVEGNEIARIERGLVALVGVQRGDGDADARFLAEKIAGLRIFEDDQGKMNLDIAQAGGEILLVSQFTLLGDARKGRRPSFIDAAQPEEGERLIELLKSLLLAAELKVQTGRFRADMQVSLINDGPVTILLDSRKLF